MSETQTTLLARLRQRLEARDAFLRQEIDATHVRGEAADYDTTVAPVRDSGDDAVADLEQTLNLSDVARDMGELDAIGSALARMQSGDYGVCIACGTEIAPARLEAQPTAVRCLRCQDAYERRHGLAPPPTL